MNELQLTVAKAYPKDAGRGMARLDPYILQALQLSPGDIIEITGRKSTGAKVWRADRQDWGQETIRIDSYVRQNAGAGIGEPVKIKPANVKEAERVVFAPPQGSEIQFGPDADAIVKHQLFKRPVLLGDTMPILTTPSPFGGQTIPLIVTETVPEGMVLVDKRTEVILLEKPVIGFDSAKGTGITYEDIGGLHDEVERVREMIELPMKHPEVFQTLGVEPPKGILMHGPPGTGKTLIAKAVANESGAHFLYIAGPEIMGKYYGESEQRLRDIFEEAEEKSPSIIFIDEIDSIAPKREDVYGEVERRVVAQLLSLMDGLEERGQVVVIAATNRVNAIDPALRRPGRFDREVEIGVPDLDDRIEILQIHVRGMPLDDVERVFTWDMVPGSDSERLLRYLRINHDIGWVESAEIRKSDDGRTIHVSKGENSMEITIDEGEEKVTLRMGDGRTCDLKVKEEGDDLNLYDTDMLLRAIAEGTYGFVGADLSALTREAAMKALRRYLPKINLNEEIPAELLDEITVLRADFEEAMREIEPSAMREVIVEIPHVTWDDVGGLDAVRQELKEVIEWPLKNPQKFERMGITPPRGILLYGPPGTGKTLLAKAAANESNANFISVSGPQLLSKWLGDSEKAIRETFKKAKQVAPAIIFFDELDAIAPYRGTDSSRVTDRVLNQLLTEMDGLQTLTDVIVVAATNRPDIVDPALIRSGRFDRLVYAGVTTKSGREDILRIHTRKMPLSGVNLSELAEMTEGYVGSDLEALCRESAMLAMREGIEYVELRHFEEALQKIRPTVSPDLTDHYQRVQEKFKGGSPAKKESSSYIGYR
ncbi:MAG: CDC48 family AAA ATPase [Candidatus Methanogasteraceae archaeon]